MALWNELIDFEELIRIVIFDFDKWALFEPFMRLKNTLIFS
jgi:hypothetical protein